MYFKMKSKFVILFAFVLLSAFAGPTKSVITHQKTLLNLLKLKMIFCS
jgi:hypothetical protein